MDARQAKALTVINSQLSIEEIFNPKKVTSKKLSKSLIDIKSEPDDSNDKNKAKTLVSSSSSLEDLETSDPSEANEQLESIFYLDQDPKMGLGGKENPENSSSFKEEFFSVNDSENNMDMIDVDEVCSCKKHEGKQLLNLKLDISLDQLYKVIFTECEFMKKLWLNRKVKNVKFTEWESNNTRKMSYSIDIGALGKAINVDNQKLLEKNSKCIVLEQITVTGNVPYCDYFTVQNLFCLTKCKDNKSCLIIHSSINYIKPLNFIVKSFIEKNTFSSLRDNFEYYKKNLVLIQRDPATITTKKATETSKQLSGILPASRDSKDQPKPVESDQNLIKPTISPLESIGGESEESDEEVSIQNDNTKEMNLSGNKSFRIFLALFLCVSFLNIILYVQLNKAESLVVELRTEADNKKFVKDLLISCGCQEELVLKRNSTLRKKLANMRDTFRKVESILDKFESDLNEYEEMYFANWKQNL